jgi:hypothetical protein
MALFLDEMFLCRWWYGGLVFTLTHRNYEVRQHAKTCFSKLCSFAEDGGIKLQAVLLEKFAELLQNQEVRLLGFHFIIKLVNSRTKKLKLYSLL